MHEEDANIQANAHGKVFGKFWCEIIVTSDFILHLNFVMPNLIFKFNLNECSLATLYFIFIEL